MYYNNSVQAVEIMCLRLKCGVAKYDRIRNGRIYQKTGFKLDWWERAELAILRKYARRMKNRRYARKTHESSVSGMRPRKRWSDGVNETITSRGLDVK